VELSAISWCGPDGVLQHGEAVAALKKKQSSALLLVSLGSASWRRHQLGLDGYFREVETTWHENAGARRLHGASTRSPSPCRPTAAWGWDSAAGLAGYLQRRGVERSYRLADQRHLHSRVLLSGYRQLAVSPLVPKNGTVLADGTFPGSRQPIALDLQARLRHVHALGPTGTGKSTLLVNMVSAGFARWSWRGRARPEARPAGGDPGRAFHDSVAVTSWCSIRLTMNDRWA